MKSEQATNRCSSPKNSPFIDQQQQRARTIYLHSVSFLHPAVLVEIDSTLKQSQDILNKGTVSHLSVEGVHAKGPALSGLVVHGSEHLRSLREPLELASSPEAGLSQEGLTIGLALSGQHARHLCQPPEDHCGKKRRQNNVQRCPCFIMKMCTLRTRALLHLVSRLVDKPACSRS